MPLYNFVNVANSTVVFAIKKHKSKLVINVDKNGRVYYNYLRIPIISLGIKGGKR